MCSRFVVVACISGAVSLLEGCARGVLDRYAAELAGEAAIDPRCPLSDRLRRDMEPIASLSKIGPLHVAVMSVDEVRYRVTLFQHAGTLSVKWTTEGATAQPPGVEGSLDLRDGAAWSWTLANDIHGVFDKSASISVARHARQTLVWFGGEPANELIMPSRRGFVVLQDSRTRSGLGPGQ